MADEILRIEGGHKLNGEVTISGAKNATVALIPAVVLADEPVIIHGVPDIEDVKILTEILKMLNIEVNFNDGRITIDPTNIKNNSLDNPIVSKLRGSYYFMGSLLGRFKDVKIQMVGGCDFGPRPIDLHIKGFEALGASVNYEKGCHVIKADKLSGNTIYLDIASVGATINIILAATKASGRTVIENAAKEPEIIDLVNLLNKMGANIRGAGTDVITIEGVDYLKGCVHEIIPDRIEAGTYVIAAIAGGGRVTIKNIIPSHLDALLAKLVEMGVHMDVNDDSITIHPTNIPLKAVNIKTQTYPGFATDFQQPLTALLTQAEGVSQVKETIYADRFKHCEQLNRMGAQTRVEPTMAIIQGATTLYGTTVKATDLRCGAALIIAGLMAEGITEIENINHIDRGYENIDGKLNALGAKITRTTR